MLRSNFETEVCCWFLAVSIAVLNSGGNSLQAQTAASRATAIEDEKLFDWFDQLGFHEYSNLPFVKVTTGWWSRSGNDAPENSTIHAFKMRESKDGFTIYSLELSEQTFTLTPPETPDHEVVKLEPADLAEYARTVLRRHNERTQMTDSDSWRRFGSELNEGSEFVILARACAAQNEPELSRQLLVAARELLKQYKDADEPETSLQDDFSDDLANMSMWRIIVDFGNVQVSRTDLSKRLDQFLKNFPKSTHHQRAKETAELLHQMVEEDRAHKTPEDFDKLTIDEKVAELVFQLRDQNGHQWSQPGSCDIFSGDLLRERLADSSDQAILASPAQQLVEIGFDAVPQLINALEDQRFTRSVGYHRNFYFSHHVLRVGDAAEQILTRIANRGFYERKYTNAGMVKDGEQLTVKEQVENWWREIQTKGEKQALIDATKLGNENSTYQAQSLIEKYPDVALEAIVQGAREAKGAWIRNSMTRLSGSLGETAIKFLTEEMAQAPALSNRVSAASQLENLKTGSANEAMIREWKKLADQAAKSESDNSSLGDGVEELVEFLATRNSPDTIKALHNQFHDHSILVRFNIVAAFIIAKSSVSTITVESGGSPNISFTATPVDALVAKEIESLLITALSDTERRKGISGSWDDYSFNDPRICDEALYALATRFPEKYKFKSDATRDAAETLRIQSINLWRMENGIELIPDYQPRRIERLPPEQTGTILAAALAAKDPTELEARIGELRELGIGALPAIIETIEGSTENSMNISELRELSRQLALTVSLIRIPNESVEIPKQLSDQLAALEQEPLTSAEPLIDLLVCVAKELPKGATGIKLSARRDNAEAGIELEVLLTKKRPPKNGTMQSWNIEWMAAIDGKNRGGPTGFWSLDHGTERRAYSDFSKSVDSAVNSTYDTPFEIKFSLIRDE